MAIKKSQLYSSLWASCDELRGGMDASQYKDYVLTMLFVKYVSDKYSNDPHSCIEVPDGATFNNMVALKGQPDIGDRINKEILRPLFSANGLEGSMELVDFNDDEKLGSGKEKVDRLSNLISIFENPALNFANNRAEDDDILGDAYEYLMRHFATESGKSKGQFYTPAEVSRIMAKIIDVDKLDMPSYTAYDPTCGSGSLLLKVAEESPNGLTLYGQEKDIATKGLAIMNMWLHGYPTAEITGGGKSTISDPQFKESDTQLKRFDRCVANPPFSTKNWSNGIIPMEDVFNRFIGYGEPPAKNGDYAFLLHIIASLKSTGKGAVILPHGVLFRGNAEAAIRESILRRRLIKGIIGLPANLFYGTGIPACIIVIDKEGADTREGIFMIDASKGYKKDGAKNRLREQDLHKIVDVFNNRWEIEKYSRFVPFEEIEKNEYNLNIPRYIDTQEEEDIQDLSGHLNGGIPDRDINSLKEYWEVYPNLKTTLFSDLREGYKKLNVEKSQVKETIFSHHEFKAYSEKLNQIFEGWNSEVYETLGSITNDSSPKQLIHTISEAILEHYSNRPLIIRYDIYQHLMDYWDETMKDDVYIIIEDGWQAKVDRIIVKGKDKGWTCELIPKDLVKNRFLSHIADSLNSIETLIESTESKIEELQEEFNSEDECLYNVSSKKDAVESLNQYTHLFLKEHMPTKYEILIELEKQLDELLDNKKKLELTPELESIRNDKGNITKKVAKEKVKDMFESESKREIIGLWLETYDNISKLKKQSKELIDESNEKLDQLKTNNEDYEFVSDIRVIEDYISLNEDLKNSKDALKATQVKLDIALLEKYQLLTEKEVRKLVIEDKWLAYVQSDIQSEIDGISQRLTGRIKELAERYEFTLGELDDKVEELEEKVSGHLEKMGLSW